MANKKGLDEMCSNCTALDYCTFFCEKATKILEKYREERKEKMANGDMVSEEEDYKRIERVVDYCNDCVIQEGCTRYCDEAEKVRDGGEVT